MDIFKQHEIFEIEVLNRMKSAKLLDPLIFRWWNMLRLCHELPRYSVDLDFWFARTIPQRDFFDKGRGIFEKYYEIIDAQIKHFTLLFELRSGDYPKRLKIEIRRTIEDSDFEETIAFSSFTTIQVALRAHTLYQAMKNKVKAFLDRGEIRDCFDIDFLLRRGIEIPDYIDGKKAGMLLKKIDRFRDRDFKVQLGSILEPELREYYVTKRFTYLKGKLSATTR